MPSSYRQLKVAFSKDRSLVAVVPPSAASSHRVAIQICQVSPTLCHLQSTLTHNSVSAQDLKEIIFCGNSAVIARFGSSQVLAWDLERGVVSQSFDARDGERFVGLAANESESSSFSVLVEYQGQKLVVQEYDSSNGKLLRKIKSGRWEGADNQEAEEGMQSAMLCVSSTHVVVQASPGVLRVMDNRTGKKIGKVKAGKSSGTFVVAMSLTEDGDTPTLVTALNTGSTTLYDASNCQEIMRTSAFSSSCAPVQLSAKTLLVGNTIFAVQGQSLQQLTTLESAFPIAPFLNPDGDRVMTLIYEKRSGCKVQHADISDLPDTLNLDESGTSEGEENRSSKTETSAKRKATEPMVLGPGQAGAEVVPPVKKAKADEEMDEDEGTPSEKDISIAERLKQLSSAFDPDADEDDEDEDDEDDNDNPASSFKAKQATTETLKELLSQALQSGEDALFEKALEVRDAKVISTTMREIDSSLVATLISKLTARLASNPLRAESLTPWLSHCLKQGRLPSPQNIQLLAPLRNLICERTESLPDLLLLEGRLTSMCEVDQ